MCSKRIFAALLPVLLTALLLVPGGCGGRDLSRELIGLLQGKAGTVERLSFSCLTGDGERTYREEIRLSFPDEYRYRFYEYRGGVLRLSRYAAQSGERLMRARAGDPQAGASVQAELLDHVPPLRNTGFYLSLYHLPGNADYYQSLISLLEQGSLVLSSREVVDGRDLYHLHSGSGLQPETDLWLDAADGLPRRKEITLSQSRRISFSYQELEVNGEMEMEPFPESIGDVASLFGVTELSVQLTTRDGGCRSLEMGEAEAAVGFKPLLPEMEGWEMVRAYWRDPAAYRLASTEQSLEFPQGFRELYLVYRQGARQAEIREVPQVEDFGYYTTGLGMLSEAYLVRRETLEAETGNASYLVALDCQEMQLAAGGLEITVTGDLSLREFEDLARRLQSLAADNP